MGLLYSHIVFQPPNPPTYDDDAGVMTFRKPRTHGLDSDDDQSTAAHSTDATAGHSSADQRFVHHPIFYLQTSRGNTIPAAFFHRPGAYFTILFSHGNGEDLGITAPYCLELSNTLNASVLCYDYSGYGLADGKSSEANCYSDIQAAYTYLLDEQRINPSRILLFGRSLGSGPTVDLACRLGSNLGGVVLIAALTSCVRVVFNYVSTMRFDMFPNIDKINRVTVPVFCVHGMMDDVVPFAHGLELSRRAKYPLEPLWIRGAGHNNLESSRFQADVFTRYAAVLREFLYWTPPVSSSPSHQQQQNTVPRNDQTSSPPRSPRSHILRPKMRHSRINHHHHNVAATPSANNDNGVSNNTSTLQTIAAGRTNRRRSSSTVSPSNASSQTNSPTTTSLSTDTSTTPNPTPMSSPKSVGSPLQMLSPPTSTTTPDSMNDEEEQHPQRSVVNKAISLDPLDITVTNNIHSNNNKCNIQSPRKHSSSPTSTTATSTGLNYSKKRRDSVTALAKAAGCFGGSIKQKHGEVDYDDDVLQTGNNNDDKRHRKYMKYGRRKSRQTSSAHQEDGNKEEKSRKQSVSQPLNLSNARGVTPSSSGNNTLQRQAPATARAGASSIWKLSKKSRQGTQNGIRSARGTSTTTSGESQLQAQTQSN